jgi:cytochrome c-type biogenesis protein CcmH/NrfG
MHQQTSADPEEGSHFQESLRERRRFAGIIEALRLTPDNPQIYANLGDTLVRLERPAEAVKCYQTALQLAPDDAKTKAKLQALGGPAELKSP